ncbi:unnamed protein product [Danaus chrysippus]|uniref:(African queen) hypothetical protein n=1 Tax=Danaus chrysippus TaxID=151541 RepID=A0A8J2W1T0_9NEOP|nr:unnamed protein product [Danaus chrysippus]
MVKKTSVSQVLDREVSVRARGIHPMEAMVTVEEVLVKVLVMEDKVRMGLVRVAFLDLVAEDPVPASVMVDMVRVGLVREVSLGLVAEDLVQEGLVMVDKVRADSIREASLDTEADQVKEALEAMGIHPMEAMVTVEEVLVKVLVMKDEVRMGLVRVTFLDLVAEDSIAASVMVDMVRVGLVREVSLGLVAEDLVQEGLVTVDTVRADSIREASLDTEADQVKEALEAMMIQASEMVDTAATKIMDIKKKLFEIN